MGKPFFHRIYSNPPALPAAADVSRWPASVNLGTIFYLADRRNATTATATSRDGYQFHLTFCLTEAPAISYCCLHSPDYSCSNLPHIVDAEAAFVLIRAQFSQFDDAEYFMYRAGPGPPSLERVQDPDGYNLPVSVLRSLENFQDPDQRISVLRSLERARDPDGYNHRISVLRSVAVVPCGEAGADYLLAGLGYRCTHYELYIYSSVTHKWTKKVLDLLPGVNAVVPDKVIHLGEGMLGWVDLWHGILMFNVHEDHPKIRYIPLPEPLPINDKFLRPINRRKRCPRLYRDVTGSNGVIKFFEMEHRRVRVIRVAPESPEKVKDPSEEDVLLDSDLLAATGVSQVIKKKKKTFSVYDGWRAVTWNRTVSSNCWIKGCLVDVDDILISNSASEMLLSMLRDKGDGALTFRDLYSASPDLGIDGGDIVYLKTKVKFEGPNGWLVAIDLGKKTLEVLTPYHFEFCSLHVEIFRPIVFANHLTVSPGLENTAFCQITQEGCLENDPNKAMGCAGESNTSTSENKRPRLSPERVSHAHNGAQRVKRNVHLPSASVPQPPDPVLLNIGLQQPACFQMTQTGYSESDTNNSTIHLCVSDPKWQQAPPPMLQLNNRDRASQHGYEQRYGGSYCVAPNLHAYGTPSGYGNYQQKWQQAPPPMLQLNNRDGANQHGYEQRYSGSYCLAPNLHAYGTPSGYGNYQQKWQRTPPPMLHPSSYGAWHEPRPLQQLPAHAAWQLPPPLQQQTPPLSSLGAHQVKHYRSL